MPFPIEGCQMQESAEPERLSVFWKCLSVLVALLGLYWCITGEIAIHSRGIYLHGIAARIVGFLWMFILLVPVFRRTGRRTDNSPSHE